MPRVATSGRTLFFTVIAIVGLLGLGLSVAHADKVHKKFKGKIILSVSPFPTSFDSDGDMIRYIKKARTKKFIKNKHGKWNIEYIAFLKSKLDQKDAVLVFFDVTYRGEPEEVFSTTFRPDDPYAKVVISYLTLSDEFFKAGRKYEMQFTRGRKTKALATVTFELTD